MATSQATAAQAAAVLKNLDSRRFSFFHIKMIIISGMGFFTDAYDLFCIGLMTKLIGRIYYQDSPYVAGTTVNPGKLPLEIACAVTAVALCGTLAGQILFGRLGDMLGRKTVYGITLACMIFCALAQSMSFGRESNQVIGTLCFWRFLLGVGVGGDYPLSATIMSEYSSTMSRGAYIGSVFAMQGVGYLVASAISAIVCACINAAYPSGEWPQAVPGCKSWILDLTGSAACPAANQLEYYNMLKRACPSEMDMIWRIVLAFGCFPAACTMYFRAHMAETPRFTIQVAKNLEATVQDAAIYLDPTSVKTATSSDQLVHISQSLTFGQFIRRHGTELTGAAMTWCLLDVAFYSQNLFQSDLFIQIGFLKPASRMNAIEETSDVAKAQAIVALGSTIPGYWFTVFFVDILGRKKIQYMGFFMMTAFMAFLAGFYFTLLNPNDPHNNELSDTYETRKGGWITMYCLTFFFANFGPNSTTFIMPAELFPTEWKSTGHGICAAMGKSGAILGAFGFLYSANPAAGEITWSFPCDKDFTVNGSLVDVSKNSDGSYVCKRKNNCPTGRKAAVSTLGEHCDICIPHILAGCYPFGIGIRASLGVLAGTNFLGMLFTALVPETMGKTLEELNGEDGKGGTTGKGQMGVMPSV